MKSWYRRSLVGGISSYICPFVLLGTAVNTAATTLNGGATGGFFRCCLTLECLEDCKSCSWYHCAIVYYKGDKHVGGSVCLHVIVLCEVTHSILMRWVGDSCAIRMISFPCIIEEKFIRRIKGILA